MSAGKKVRRLRSRASGLPGVVQRLSLAVTRLQTQRRHVDFSEKGAFARSD